MTPYNHFVPKRRCPLIQSLTAVLLHLLRIYTRPLNDVSVVLELFHCNRYKCNVSESTHSVSTSAVKEKMRRELLGFGLASDGQLGMRPQGDQISFCLPEHICMFTCIFLVLHRTTLAFLALDFSPLSLCSATTLLSSYSRNRSMY